MVSAHAQRIASLLSADKELVFCRESKGGMHAVRCELACRPGGGRRQATARRTQRAGKGATLQIYGSGHGAERTSNMWIISVTPEVSQLSG